MRDHKSLQYELLQACNLQNVKNNSTLKSLKTDTKAFADWCKSEGGVRRLGEIDDPKALIQAYADYLIAEGKYTAGTIHRKIYAPCRALGISMRDVDKPKRTQATIVRGRRDDPDAVPKRGDLEAAEDRHARLVACATLTGLRRSEIRRLKGGDLQKDESGYLCVRVIGGKGGKDQLQRILPSDADAVRQLFAGVPVGKKLFANDDMSNNINIHRYRALHAQSAYDYYLGRLTADPAYRKQLMSELKSRYNKACPGRDADKWLMKEIGVGTPYVLRGKNKQRALDMGKPVTYDRIALLATSVFFLSHWRLDVTISNYMLV